MSAVDKSCDLQLMAEYDFKAPINATIQIYDSDEEINTSVEKEQTNDITTKNIDSIVSEIFKDLCKVTKKTKHGSVNSNTNERKGRKRPLSEPNKKKSKKNKVSINDPVFENQSDSLNRDDANFSNDTLISKNYPSSDMSQIFPITQQSRNEVHPLVLSSQILVPHCQENVKSKANECIQMLLDTISTHMIFIMKNYVEYVVVTRRTSDKTAIEKAKKNYIDARSHFFYMSFSTVSNIMLPKENNLMFVEKFIDNTMEIAKARNLYFKRCDMKTLCTDMFVWVKSRMKHPILSEILNNEYQPITASSNMNDCREQQSYHTPNSTLNKTCVYRNETYGVEVTVNQNTIQQYRNVYSDSYIHNKAPSVSSEKQPEAQPDYNLQYAIQQPKTFRHKTNAHPQIQHDLIYPLEITPRPPPAYHYKQTWQQDQAVTRLDSASAHYYQNIQPDQGQINRSVSRDSGFMSPSSSVFNDPMCVSPRTDQMDSSSSATPFITHVTSLNPNVSYIKDGKCQVCGKHTQQKCLGCYKSYYCSHHCQNVDWKNHVRICK